ncbi:hypothetical protein EDB19DRAFT_463679 [Suillus lakei]|nr:hypothetical protein EDB19DRAFT_463679 [Suillus lakei]
MAAASLLILILSSRRTILIFQVLALTFTASTVESLLFWHRMPCPFKPRVLTPSECWTFGNRKSTRTDVNIRKATLYPTYIILSTIIDAFRKDNINATNIVVVLAFCFAF